MLNNSETELSLTKKPEIIHKIYKQKLSVEENLNKEEENTTNLQDSHNLSSNLLNQEQKLFPSNKKINEIVLDNSKNINFKINSNVNNQLKKINKKVSFKEPFFSVIYVQSFKKSNSKMTYNEYDPTQNYSIFSSRFCRCKNKFCLIY